ncbi:MAG: choice-of-anchor Q domain-containing protein, partial [Dokdonella sp.]
MISSMSGIGIRESTDAAAASSITARLYNNVLIGNDHNASSNGVIAQVKRGEMSLQVINNTITGWFQSVYAGSYNSPGTGTQNIDGLVVNNVMVSRGPAFFLQTTTTASLSNSYNLVNAPSDGTSLGSNSILSPARLVSESLPRLRGDSPAIGAADTGTLGFGIIFNALPGTDADGLRRIKGIGGGADIGAYEFGDVSFEHRVTGSGSNISRVYSTAFDGVSSALVQASVVDSPLIASVAYDRPYGFYYTNSSWRFFDEGLVALSPGTTFSGFAPGSGGGPLRHVATPAAITSFFTLVDNSSFNNSP